MKGLRTQKIVTENGTTTATEYTYHSNMLTYMKKGSDELHFFYDAQTRPTKAEYNEEKYHYLHNLQGDIVGIIDRNGNSVVEYKYDVWGKLLSITGTMLDIMK